jgi:hypothetical protein
MRDDSRSTSVPGRKTTMYRPSIAAPRLVLGACVGVGRGATGDGTSLHATAAATDAIPANTSFFMMQLTGGGAEIVTKSLSPRKTGPPSA